MTSGSTVLTITGSSLTPSTGSRGVGGLCPTDCHCVVDRVCPHLHRDSCAMACAIHPFSVRRTGMVLGAGPRRLSLRRVCLITRACRPNSPRFGRMFSVTIHLFPSSRATGLGTTYASLRGNSLMATRGRLTGTKGSGRTRHVEGVCKRVGTRRWGWWLAVGSREL